MLRRSVRWTKTFVCLVVGSMAQVGCGAILGIDNGLPEEDGSVADVGNPSLDSTADNSSSNDSEGSDGAGLDAVAARDSGGASDTGPAHDSALTDGSPSDTGEGEGATGDSGEGGSHVNDAASDAPDGAPADASCVPDANPCSGLSCGTVRNSCNQQVTCGACPSGQTCDSNNQCCPNLSCNGACGILNNGCSSLTCPPCEAGGPPPDAGCMPGAPCTSNTQCCPMVPYCTSTGLGGGGCQGIACYGLGSLCQATHQCCYPYTCSNGIQVGGADAGSFGMCQ